LSLRSGKAGRREVPRKPWFTASDQGAFKK